jgi:hypothetical protein
MVAPWLHARGKAGFYSTETSGKWCILRPPELINEAWDRIQTVVKAGELVSAKVSRARKGHHQICVYTENWCNEAELRQCRDTLRKLGFTEKLGYKRDIDTLRRIYGTLDEWYRWD